MAKRLAILVWLCLFSHIVYGDELSVEQAVKRVELPQQLGESGSFVQHKYFRVLKKPFVSSGNFTQRENVFEWTTLSPIRSALIFDGKKLWQQQEGEAMKPLLVAGHYIPVIKALVTGNITSLSQFFSIYEHESMRCILLKPKDKSIELAAKSVELCNVDEKLKIKLNEVEGNYTEIVITQTQANQDK